MAGGNYPNTWDKYQVFFAKMVDGLLPYLQLYSQRNRQRGGGIGNAKGAHLRGSVIIPNINAYPSSSQIGGAHSLNIVSPVQQSVERAKSLIKEGYVYEENISMLGSGTKRKQLPKSHQNGNKRAKGETVSSAKSKKTKTKTTKKKNIKLGEIKDLLS